MITTRLQTQESILNLPCNLCRHLQIFFAVPLKNKKNLPPPERKRGERLLEFGWLGFYFHLQRSMCTPSDCAALKGGRLCTNAGKGVARGQRPTLSCLS